MDFLLYLIANSTSRICADRDGALGVRDRAAEMVNRRALLGALHFCTRSQRT